MAHPKKSKRSKARTMLRLADLEQSKNAVLHLLGAARAYGPLQDGLPLTLASDSSLSTQANSRRFQLGYPRTTSGHAAAMSGFQELRARFRRAVTEGDLPINADVETLANFVQTVNFGLTVQASTGATRKDLLRVVAAALQAWPK